MNRVQAFAAAAASAAVLFAAVRPATASKPVDDFEVGAFSVQTSGNYVQHDVVIGTPHVHVLSDARRVVLDTTNGSAAASLAPGTTLDDAATVDLTGDGYCQFLYEFHTPIDITQNGANDRIVVELDAGVVGGTVTVAITSQGVGEGNSHQLTWAGPQSLTFPLSEFTLADPEEALGIAVRFATPGADARYIVADIRLTAYVGQAVNFEGDFVAIQMPPVPTPPLRFRVFDLTGDKLFRVDIPVLDARDIEGIVPPIRATWEETAGLGGEIAGIYFERAGIDPQPFIETTFDLAVNVTPVSGQLPEIGYPPDPIVGDRSILLEFPVIVHNTAGYPMGSSNVQLFLDIHEGQPLQFNGVSVIPTEGGLRGGTITGFQLSFTVDRIGEVDEDEIFFEGTWISDWTPDGTTSASSSDPLIMEALRLVAAPSVTGAATTLHASRPFARGWAVEIFDVGGRAIRHLAGLEGSRTVTWDGESESGASVPSGVYFARVAGQSGPATRIVKIR
jgi:hypothetical protein